MELAEDMFSESFYAGFSEKFFSIWRDSPLVRVTQESVEWVKKNLLGIVGALYEMGQSNLFDLDMAMQRSLGRDHFGTANLSRALDILKGDVVEGCPYRLTEGFRSSLECRYS